MSRSGFFRSTLGPAGLIALALLAASPLAASSPADARAGGGFSFGSRGTRTFSAPAFTPTAPRSVQPFGRTDTPGLGANVAQPRRFGFGGGLLAGLLGAGLFGSLFGGGFLWGIAALFGLLFKLLLIGGAIWLVFRLFRGRAMAPVMGGGYTAARTGYGGLPGAAPATPRGTGPATIGPQDYAAFEQTLIAVQEAYSREDRVALSTMGTPEIARDLAAEIDANRQRGVRNDVSGTRLVKGDLSEAWSEGSVTYATVAMRFAAIDVMVDRSSGRIVSGDPVHPVEAVELWTFRREGGGWLLSGIQQGG